MDLDGDGQYRPMGGPIGTDFVSFWTVLWALLNGPARDLQSGGACRLEQAIVQPARTVFYPWEYPHRTSVRLSVGAPTIFVVPRALASRRRRGLPGCDDGAFCPVP